MSNVPNSKLSLGFLRMAYNDYIAARVLLNRNYTLQGIILASTAVERYLKAMIAIFKGSASHYHMDKFEHIKKEVVDIGYGILFDKIDPVFFEILSKAYKIRYYDNIKTPFCIGFFKNQFLGELDGAIELFERAFTIRREPAEEQVLSPLKMDYRKKNPDLFENNWVTTTAKDKKSFMEENCIGFGLYIHPDRPFEELDLTTIPVSIPYTGQMSQINIKEEERKISETGT